METILWKNYYGQFYGKKGLDWTNSRMLRMYEEQRDTYGTILCASESRIAKRSEAKQIRLAARNTNLWNNPLVRHVQTNEVSEHMSPSERRELLLQVRTNEVSEHMLQKRPRGASSDRRKLLLQVRTNEVSEHMLQKRPKGALSDRSSERSERQRERQATEGSGER